MIDASVIAKWVLPGEPYQREAVRLKEDRTLGLMELVAPGFITQEVANALWRAVKLGRISEEDAEGSLRALGDMGIELHDLGWAQVSEALTIASSLDLTVYDASYLLLSNRLRAPLITADQTLWGRAKEHFRVIHIKTYT